MGAISPPNTRVQMAMLARTIAQCGALTRDVGGTIRFWIRGEVSAWLLDLDRPGGTWTEVALDAAARVEVELSAASLWTFLTDAPAVPGLLVRGDIAVRGESFRLAKLGALIERS